MSKLKRYDGTNWQSVNGQIVGDTFPIGGVLPYPGSTAPTNWLICDGRAVSRTTYSELFAVIGTEYGSGDGSTTFNLPDIKGRTVMGGGTPSQNSWNGYGTLTNDQLSMNFQPATLGEYTHQLNTSEMPTHGFYGLYWDVTPFNLRSFTESSSGARALTVDGGIHQEYNPHTLEIGSNTPHNNIQPSTVIKYWIIKAKQSVGLVGNVTETQSNSHIDTYSCSYINSALSNVNVYSTNEVKVGKWVNNKDIYRKVLITTTSGTYIEDGKRYTWYPKSSYDANNQIEFMTDMRVNVVGDRQFFNNSNMEIDLQLYTDGQIQLGTVSSRTTTSTPVYITIEYTKR